jgi:hypothetical protein
VNHFSVPTPKCSPSTVHGAPPLFLFYNPKLDIKKEELFQPYTGGEIDLSPLTE